MRTKRMWARLTTGLILAAFTVTTVPAFAAEPAPAFDFKYDMSKLQKPFIPASPTSDYQIRVIGEKFAALFDPNGAPMVVFDLSLNQLSLTEVALGGFGLGDLNPLRLVRLIKKIKKARKQSDAAEEVVIDELPAVAREEALKTGKKFFKELRLTEEWANRNGIVRSTSEKKPGVAMPAGASFSLADIEFKNEKLRAEFYAPILAFARAMFRETEWNDVNIRDFAREMEFRYVDAKPGYEMVWNRSIRPLDHQPKLPGIVVNFLYPWDNLGYKYTYAQIDSQMQHMRRRLGLPGILIEMFFSRVCHALIERIEYHERQLIGLLEAQERFEYDANMPKELVDISLDLLYLSAWYNTGGAGLTDAAGKRRMIRTMQEDAREKVLKKLAQQGRDTELAEAGDGKFLITRKNGKFTGVLGSGIKPQWLFKSVTRHVGGGSPAVRLIERNALEIAGFLARAFLPSSFRIKLGAVQGGVTVDPFIYEMFFRDRMVYERMLEGELVGLADEAAAGRYSLGLSADETKHVRKYLRAVAMNPYEEGLDEEKASVERNLKNLKQMIAGNVPPNRFRYGTLIPMLY